MRVAIAVARDRISPLFDASRRLLIVDVVDGHTTQRSHVDLHEPTRVARVAQLVDSEVQVLVCGAISRELQLLVEDAGIHLFSYIVGDVERVLCAFLEGALDAPEFQMPGHGRGSPCVGSTPQRG